MINDSDFGVSVIIWNMIIDCVLYCDRRLEYVNRKCSITNTDVLSHVTTDEVVQEDLATADSNCTVPIVHLTSDLLETDALNLLAKGTYVDTLLTTLPVCPIMTLVLSLNCFNCSLSSLLLGL